MGLWHRLAEEYSEPHLSDPRDKMVALEGLVERFAASSADTCVAGLWRRHLLDDLLWKPYPGGSYSRPPVYRSPSWSWASIEGPIWYHERKEWRNISHAVVEEINVEIESGRPEIKPGHIIVQGSLLDVPFSIETPQSLNVICGAVTWNPILESNSSTTIPARSSVAIDILLDSKEDYSTHARINNGIIINIQMQSRERYNNLASFDKCQAIGLLLRPSGYGLYTLSRHVQDFPNSSWKLMVILKESACSKANGLICGLCSNCAHAPGEEGSKLLNKSLPYLKRRKLQSYKCRNY
jgi:hypothetical protein